MLAFECLWLPSRQNAFDSYLHFSVVVFVFSANSFSASSTSFVILFVCFAIIVVVYVLGNYPLLRQTAFSSHLCVLWCLYLCVLWFFAFVFVFLLLFVFAFWVWFQGGSACIQMSLVTF